MAFGDSNTMSSLSRYYTSGLDNAQSIGATIIPYLKQWGIDPYELLKKALPQGYIDREDPAYRREAYVQKAPDYAKNYLDMFSVPTADTSKQLRLVANSKDEAGIFGNGSAAAANILFAQNGAMKVSENSQLIASQYTQEGADGTKYGLSQKKNLRSWGDQILINAALDQYIQGKHHDAKYQQAKQKGGDNLMDYTRFQGVVTRDLEATLPTGENVKGANLLELLEQDDRFSVLDQVDRAYSTYLDNYINGNVSFSNGAAAPATPNQSQSAAPQQSANQSWGAGMTPQQFNQARRLSWGQSGIQGV